MRRETATILPVLCVAMLLGGLTIAPSQAEDLTKEDLVKRLQCRPEQEGCQAEPPPTSNRRSFQLPARRGIRFEHFTKGDRDKIIGEASAGKLPTADVEIYFDYDKADVTPLAQKALAPLGQALSDTTLAGSRFVLIGHTDAKGGDAYNQVLSERRAAAVREYLLRTFTIAPERLISAGSGKSRLKNTGDPYAAENRRVQVINGGVVAGVDQKP